MRRALKALFPAVAAGVFAIGLAVPALAEEAQESEHAEESEHADESDDHADESDDHGDESDDHAEPTGFGSGQWDGLIAAAAAGVVLGVAGFAASRPGEIGGHGGDHH